MTAADEILRLALDAAVRVAREAAGATPPLDIPRALVPLIGFRRMSAAAYATVRRVLDDDPAFREMVAASVEEADVGRGGYLFLARPDGWDDELRRLADALEEAEALDRAAREDDAARRRADVAEARVAALEGQVAVLEARAASLDEEVAHARLAQVAAEHDRSDAAAELADLRDRLSRIGSERDAAHRRASRLDNERAELAAEVERLSAELRCATAPTGADGGAGSDVAAGAEGAPVAPAGEAPPGRDRIDRERVSAAIDAAARAAVELGRALAEAAGALDPDDDGRPASSEEQARARPHPPPAGPRPQPASRPTRERAPSGRLPVVLPPAVFDDTPEAASFLARVPGAVLVVDGYNASLGAWPGIPIGEQRRRLVDALEELAARTGVQPHVVFDGTEEGVRPVARGRRSVRVTFTPTDEEADDLILDLIDGTPESTPVIVASDDRRVRLGATRRGANALTQEQLFWLLNRER
ncbi:MAG TPA: NYN domain-containing protein [Acidimicrobiales bacterium]|nr:NYN domain-containing protein [Acidimicrobiales bacterium]